MGAGNSAEAKPEAKAESSALSHTSSEKRSSSRKSKSKTRHRYDTFPAVPEKFSETGFAWEKEARPWPLLGHVGMQVGKNIAALLILFWTLLTQKEYLMQCDGRQLHIGVLYGCEYTKAYLRAFPLLAVNVCLVVSLRVLVQQRFYYGLLREGGLLDFTNAKPMRDPLFWMLIISLIHGLLHFCLKAAVHPGGLDDIRIYQSIVQHFIVPAVIFLVFFYNSADIEKNLIPLNKYFEEDYEYAQKALGNITAMDEYVVRYNVMTHDVVQDAEEYTIKSVYLGMIDGIEAAKVRTPDSELKRPFIDYQIFRAMWPARILLDSRLHDKESSGFRLMFCGFTLVCVLIQVLTLAGFGYQAYKDMVIDVYYHGQMEDVTSFVVQTVHLVAIIWITSVSIRTLFIGRCCACCGYKERDVES